VIEEQVMWRRAADYCASPEVFKIDGDDEKDVEPNDVMQGRLGNCWFCCSLASMAERPELIKRLFITKEFNEEGIYEMRFCHNGLWKVVLLDDFFPCKPYSGPIYTKSLVFPIFFSSLLLVARPLFFFFLAWSDRRISKCSGAPCKQKADGR